MALYAIHAYDSIFGGLHGIEDFDIIESKDNETVFRIADDMSREVVESYWDQYEDMYENDFDNVRDMVDEEDFHDEWINDILEATVCEITGDISGKSLKELRKELEGDPQKFFHTYCEEVH